jgi:hypothetical protein
MLLQSLLRPVLTPLMRGMFDAPVSSSAAWSPLALWPDGIATPGMWISPRDLTSQWADYTDITPVATPVATPGTVADSSNPVGLAYDLRAGTPVLGPELVTNGDFSDGATGWTADAGWVISGGQASISNVTTPTRYLTSPEAPTIVGRCYQVTFSVLEAGGVECYVWSGTADLASITNIVSPGVYTASFVATTTTSSPYFAARNATDIVVGGVSVREVPGLHMLQSTSVDRPLLSAYDGQTLGPGDTYDATGYPVFQKYNGTNSSMATAAFAAGTLIDGMDCMIAVRRDSAAACVAGLYNGIADATKFFGMAESASGSGCVGSGAGTPTVWVDNAQLTGGTAVTRGTLHTALTVGDYHILEFRGLDLSTWTAAGFGLYTSYVFPGARGDILLYPSTDSTEDKDAARQWLADYYGVTLP